MISLPTEVSRERILESIGHRSFGRCDMMLVAVSANELKQFLKLRYFDDAVTAKSVEFVFREPPLAQVGCNAARQVVRGHAAKGEGSRTDAAHDGAIGVFFADR